MRLVAMEEAAILDMLWTLLLSGIELPGAATLAARNELIFLAQKALAPRAFDRVLSLLGERAMELAGPVITRYPEPCYVDPAKATEAEVMADSHLCEGSGALWSAMRETVRSLEFQPDADCQWLQHSVWIVQQRRPGGSCQGHSWTYGSQQTA